MESKAIVVLSQAPDSLAPCCAYGEDEFYRVVGDYAKGARRACAIGVGAVLCQFMQELTGTVPLFSPNRSLYLALA